MTFTMLSPKPLVILTLILISYFPATATCSQSPLTLSRNHRIQNGVALRILPLGNSITWGYGSTTGNGYRLPLLNLLSPPNPVTYIGSQHSGNMSNNANEGHPGALISQIAVFANASLPLRPNIILLMAGTNDMAANISVPTAPSRLGSLIDQCVAACPDAVLLVAQLTPFANNDSQIRADPFNAAIPRLVATRVNLGKKVLVVDMEAFMSTGELVDGLHPNDEGYEKMAEAWYEGIKDAASKGWIGNPVDADGVTGNRAWFSRAVVCGRRKRVGCGWG